MKVKRGEVHKFNKTYPLLIEEEEWKIVHISIFGRSPQFGQCHSFKEYEEKFDALEYKGAKAFLFRRLSLKSYHSTELAEALKERRVSKERISLLLDEMRSQGYINDESWITSFVQMMRNQKFGFQSILLKLRRKGINDEVSLSLVKEIQGAESSENNEQVSIEKLLNSRYKNRDFSQKKERDKVISSLARKGYQLNDIFYVIKNNYLR